MEELKKDNHNNAELVKSPSLNEPKKGTPFMPDKKSSSNDVKKPSEIVKPPILPNKPPIPPSSRDHVMKVKNEKIVQPKVYDSHKNINKQGIIKSGGFSTHIDSERNEKGLAESR